MSIKELPSILVSTMVSSGAAAADYAKTVNAISNSGTVGAKQVILSMPIPVPFFDGIGGSKINKIVLPHSIATADLASIDSAVLTRRDFLKESAGDYVDKTITTTHNFTVTKSTAVKLGVVTITNPDFDRYKANNVVADAVAATKRSIYYLVITLTAAATSVVTFYEAYAEAERLMS
jgi:hypothetical protein